MLLERLLVRHTACVDNIILHASAAVAPAAVASAAVAPAVAPSAVAAAISATISAAVAAAPRLMRHSVRAPLPLAPRLLRLPRLRLPSRRSAGRAAALVVAALSAAVAADSDARLLAPSVPAPPAERDGPTAHGVESVGV